MSALDALLMPIPELADEMDIANHYIIYREQAAAELARLRAIEAAAREYLNQTIIMNTDILESKEKFNDAVEKYKSTKKVLADALKSK